MLLKGAASGCLNNERVITVSSRTSILIICFSWFWSWYITKTEFVYRMCEQNVWTVYVAQNFFLNTSILLHLCFKLIFLFLSISILDYFYWVFGLRVICLGIFARDLCILFGFWCFWFFFSSLPLMAPSFHFSASIWQYDISFTLIDQWFLWFWIFFLVWSIELFSFMNHQNLY